MSTKLRANQQTAISFERPQLGERPLKYYVTNVPVAKPETHTEVGVLRALYAKPKPNPQPTSLNELPATYELPVSHGYLASENADRRKADVSSELRFGGNVRCSKSMQQVTEKTYGRYNFIAPVLDNSDSHVVIKDLDFHTGKYGSNQPIPNFKAFGNNPVYDNQVGISTRNKVRENREL